jgi:hypothetical protein
MKMEEEDHEADAGDGPVFATHKKTRTSTLQQFE